MVLTDDWFTTLSHTDNKQLVFLNVRKGIQNFFETGKLRVRVDIAFPYSSEPDGMPDEASAKLIEEIEPLLKKTMEKTSWLSSRVTIPEGDRRTGPSIPAIYLPSASV